MSDRQWPASLQPTFTHIRLLVNKRDRLQQAIVEAQNQQLAAIRRHWDAGALTWGEMVDLYDQLYAAGTPQFNQRWLAAIGLTKRVFIEQAKAAPNLGVDSWHGTWPLADGDPRPLKGRHVVYVLFDPSLKPIYVGSTEHFWLRMKAHVSDGKVWSSWAAHLCRDREAAYEMENRYLEQYKPVLNVAGARYRKTAA